MGAGCGIAYLAAARPGSKRAADRRPSIAPEKLLRALLLQVIYTVRSERLLMEQARVQSARQPLAQGLAKEIPPVPGRHRSPWTRIAARPATSHGAPESDEHTALSGAARYAGARLGAA